MSVACRWSRRCGSPAWGGSTSATCRWGSWVECESYEFHSDAKSLERDVRRYTACARRGLVVVRFTWKEVMLDPDHCRRALRDVVDLRLQQAVRRTS